MDRKGSSPPEAFGRWKSQRRFHRKIAEAIDHLGSRQGSIFESVFDPAAEGEGETMTHIKAAAAMALATACLLAGCSATASQEVPRTEPQPQGEGFIYNVGQGASKPALRPAGRANARW